VLQRWPHQTGYANLQVQIIAVLLQKRGAILKKRQKTAVLCQKRFFIAI
jgi:hypothetical protein